MKQDIKDRWIRALRSGDYDQVMRLNDLERWTFSEIAEWIDWHIGVAA